MKSRGTMENFLANDIALRNNLRFAVNCPKFDNLNYCQTNLGLTMDISGFEEFIVQYIRTGFIKLHSTVVSDLGFWFLPKSYKTRSLIGRKLTARQLLYLGIVIVYLCFKHIHGIAILTDANKFKEVFQNAQTELVKMLTEAGNAYSKDYRVFKKRRQQRDSDLLSDDDDNDNNNDQSAQYRFNDIRFSQFDFELLPSKNAKTKGPSEFVIVWKCVGQVKLINKCIINCLSERQVNQISNRLYHGGAIVSSPHIAKLSKIYYPIRNNVLTCSGIQNKIKEIFQFEKGLSWMNENDLNAKLSFINADWLKKTKRTKRFAKSLTKANFEYKLVNLPHFGVGIVLFSLRSDKHFIEEKRRVYPDFSLIFTDFEFKQNHAYTNAWHGDLANCCEQYRELHKCSNDGNNAFHAFTKIVGHLPVSYNVFASDPSFADLWINFQSVCVILDQHSEMKQNESSLLTDVISKIKYKNGIVYEKLILSDRLMKDKNYHYYGNKCDFDLSQIAKLMNKYLEEGSAAIQNNQIPKIQVKLLFFILFF